MTQAKCPLHAYSNQCFQNALAYFATTKSYKLFIKQTTDVTGLMEILVFGQLFTFFSVLFHFEARGQHQTPKCVLFKCKQMLKYPNLETSSSENSNILVNVIHFFNTTKNLISMAAQHSYCSAQVSNTRCSIAYLISGSLYNIL